MIRYILDLLSFCIKTKKQPFDETSIQSPVSGEKISEVEAELVTKHCLTT